MSLKVYLYKDSDLVYEADTTHNLNSMAEAAGIYTHLWRPGEIGVATAGELVEPLRAGLHRLVERPTYFETFNARNGWGTFEQFVPFVAKYLEACVAHADATVSVST